MNPDMDAYLNQIEKARADLFIAIRSGRQSNAVRRLGDMAESAVQQLMDQIIDEVSANG